MTLVVGTDEAGYGPNLGPLVVAATCWESACDPADAEAAFAAIDRRQRIEFNAKAQIRAHEWFAAFAAPGLAAFFFGIALARPGRWGRTA